MEPKGYNGKILKVDLSSGKIDIECKDEIFYRKYLGGSALGVYYCLTEMPAGTDALAPESVLVFAPSVLTGAAVTGVSRFTVTGKSPLGGTIGDAQCGANFGPELKYSGFDAVVLKGRADKPVYLWIENGEAKLLDAEGIWGTTTGDTRALIRKQLDNPKAQIACIGPAGEKLVKFANISGDGGDYAGRTGLGAVMGSKNLKAIACRGKRSYEYADPKAIKDFAAKGIAAFNNSKFHNLLQDMGTPGVVRLQAAVGNLCTRNFAFGSFDGMEKISGETLRDTIKQKNDTCFACAVKCRNRVAATEPYNVDPEYGGPEFETIGLLGSNLLIDDIVAIAKGNELCNAYGMDTISTGAMISYAIESFENGFIGTEKTDGLTLEFANPDVMLELVRKIGEREGIGDILADGMYRSIEEFGAETEKFAIHAKGLPFPAHMAQVKMSQALSYAVNAFGADHMSAEHDWLIAGPNEAGRALGLYSQRAFSDLDYEKVKLVYYTQLFYSALDTLTLCAFCWGPDALFNYKDLENFIAAITGWQMTLWEIMKSGERRVNMMRMFNEREGFTAADDKLPDRIFDPIPEGDAQGCCVKRDLFESAKKTYYSFMGWDAEKGMPGTEKLKELSLEWLT